MILNKIIGEQFQCNLIYFSINVQCLNYNSIPQIFQQSFKLSIYSNWYSRYY